MTTLILIALAGFAAQPVGAFAEATVLSNLSTEAACPITAAILVAIGVNLMVRFSRGKVRREFVEKRHSTGFLGVLGLAGGFVDATGGGGWGPVTTSTLINAGRSEPRRIVGTANTAEFIVTAAALAEQNEPDSATLKLHSVES